jgi:hypothetical protein
MGSFSLSSVRYVSYPKSPSLSLTDLLIAILDATSATFSTDVSLQSKKLPLPFVLIETEYSPPRTFHKS